MITPSTVYTVKGSTSLTQLKDERGWDAVRGTFTLRRYEGPADAIAAEFARLVAGGDSGADDIREAYAGQHGTLTLRIPDATSDGEQDAKAISTTWEAVPVEILKPIESSPDFDTITSEKKTEILKAVREATGEAGYTGDEWILYAYLANQVTEYSEFMIRLRKVELVTVKTALRASWTGVNTVVSLASLGVPSGILSNLPSGWEWLYKGASVVASGRGYTMTSEWLGADEWATIYSGGTWVPSV